MAHITPLVHVKRAAYHFADGWHNYHFNVPEGLDMIGYANRIRKQAVRLGYKWRVVYSTVGRGWIIKERKSVVK